ncbi:hypothetical protein QFC19_000423 [Naganishia cerealis]|uniref:Uncharacterized protein n=1 Tax=Naganishia cerealis TaxID=610337 RepID=A0ACC2WM96_9TREE|nr:hypothetical protein QFC19_000423 [Naganishia cerealis]
MRCTTAIVAALAIVSIGIEALPALEEPFKADHKPVKPTASSKTEPWKPEHRPKEPEYEIARKDFAFFHNWDITCGWENIFRTRPKHLQSRFKQEDILRERWV